MKIYNYDGEFVTGYPVSDDMVVGEKWGERQNCLVFNISDLTERDATPDGWANRVMSDIEEFSEDEVDQIVSMMEDFNDSI